MLSIRPERPADHDAVRRVVTDAFAVSEFGHQGEAQLVHELRSNCPDVISLVAVEAEEILGHVLFSPVTIHSANAQVVGMGLAPMAVTPRRQRSGIGTALVEFGLAQIAVAGCPFVVVLGDAEYYPRFGFRAAAEYRVCHGFEGIPQEVFFMKVWQPSALSSMENGVAKYRSEFGPQKAGVTS